MPLPFLIGAGAALLAGAIGAGAHIDAKEKNAKAERLIDEAREMFDDEKGALERAQERTKREIAVLADAKMDVLATTLSQFVESFRKVKDNTQLRSYVGLNELAKFETDLPMILRMQKMADVSGASIKGAAAGAAVGAFALGGALTLAAAPLTMLFAPVALFSGIAASMKADENLDKAREVHAEARAKVEKMRTSRCVCDAISERCEMFGDLLKELNGMLAPCCALMTGVIESKRRGFLGRIFGRRSEEFTEQELKLMAVTASIAGAVSSVIATPIMDANGKLTDESEERADEIQKKLPALTSGAEAARSADYRVAPIKAKRRRIEQSRTKAARGAGRSVKAPLAAISLDIFGYLVAAVAAIFTFRRLDAISDAISSLGLHVIDLHALDIEIAALGMSISPLPLIVFGALGILLTSPKPRSPFVRMLSCLPRIAWAIAAMMLMYIFAEDIVSMDGFWLKNSAASIVAILVCVAAWDGAEGGKSMRIRSLIAYAAFFTSMSALSLIVMQLLRGAAGLSFSTGRAVALAVLGLTSFGFVKGTLAGSSGKTA